jgi:glycosyltransferase involved in cell wall biosynthesis
VNDPIDLAAKLSAILEKNTSERAEIGAYLRSRVERLHSLPRLVGRILDLLADNSVLGSRPTMATESPASHQLVCHQPRRRIGSDGEKSHLGNQTRALSVLYLFTRSRGALLDRVHRGEDHGNNFWGMLQLPRHGVAASYTELEKYLPKTIAEFLRTRVLRPHFVHAPLFFEFFSYDLVFTSTGFGTQLVHTLLPVRKPRWVMHDFSISSLLGEERSLKQRMFAWMVSRSDGIVTVSRPEQELLTNRFPHLRNRIAFIPFGVDLSYFKPLPAEEVREIFVPGTDPDRDYLTLFEAATGLGVPVVVTTKPDRLARLASIPSFVERKWFAPADLLLEYSRAQVVVIPLNTKSGLNDAMGLTVLQESLAMGKAIIATRTATTESFITDGMNGLLVEGGNVEALRSALDRLLTDTALRSRLGHAARQFAEEHLDSDRQTARLASFFIGLVESRCEPSCCELAATADSVEGTTIRSGRIEVPRES